MKDKLLREAYSRMYKSFGAQHWWPGDTPFEIIVGAILTQNTNWKNVERAVANLKRGGLLTAKKLLDLPPARLANLIRPAGYFRIKTKRLRNFLSYFLNDFGGKISKMEAQDADKLREKLLSVNGIGPETADSILLYALNKPVFVVDAYTKRILQRHYLVPEETNYDEIQSLFMDNLPRKVKLYNEYHALIVKCGKDFCRTKNPLCAKCPLKGWNRRDS
jgi:endonuclease-3 related protein